MQEIETAIKESKLATASLSKDEKKIFNKIKRSLLRTFVNPNHSVKIMADLTASEYIRYFRKVEEGGEALKASDKTKLVDSIRNCLSELDLTPKSKKAGEVSSTLSLIFKTMGEKHGKPSENQEVDKRREDSISGTGDTEKLN